MRRNQARVGLRSGAFIALLVALAVAPKAHANGAFPDEFSISFPAPAPHRILVGANFGLLVSEDDGATWRYSCEPWITAGSNAALSGTNVSFYQVTADAAVIAQAVQVTRTQDDACTWPFSGGAILDQVVTDMFPDPNDATLVIAIVAIARGSYLIASHDGGKTFDSTHLYDSDGLLTAVELSRSTPGVVYATTVALSGSGVSMLLRSSDSGATWTSSVIPTAQYTQPLIMAIDPLDAQTVYLRVIGADNDSIVITTDGGQTFQTVLTIIGQFSSFLRAGDGTVYAGTMGGQLYVRPPGATTFTNHSAPHFRCLGQRPGTSRIFACGDQGLDGFDVGYSDDDGGTFTRMMNFRDLLGPLTCAPVQANCQAHWARIQQVLGISDAGLPGQDGGSGPPDGGTGKPDAGPDGPDAGPSTGGSKSGSCAAAPDGTGWTTLVVLLTAITLRRRRHPRG